MKKISLFPFVLLSTICALGLMTSVVGAQSPLVSIDTVFVGDAGNAADTTGYGSVNYEFNIGKYEVTISQYTAFLNSVASVTSESHIVDLWNPNMAGDISIAGISRSGNGTLANPYSYSVIGSSNRPIAYVSWFDAARFANWVNNGATNGSGTETGAYTLNGATSGIFTKNANAAWWIPSEDEWYKAAYYKSGGTNTGYWIYPTQSDTLPGNTISGATNQANFITDGVYSVTQSAAFDPNQSYLSDVGAFGGSASAYGSYDQGGNLFEWNDAVINDSLRGIRGGNWDDGSYELVSSLRYEFFGVPEYESNAGGFRVASVPEPSTYALLLLSGAASLYALKRRKS